MIEAQQSRDSGWRRLSTVEADLPQYIRSIFVDGVAIGVEFDEGRLFAIRLRDDTANVVRYGPGGGYCWEQKMSRVQLRQFLEETGAENPEVRRGPIQEVWPLGRR